MATLVSNAPALVTNPAWNNGSLLTGRTSDRGTYTFGDYDEHIVVFKPTASGGSHTYMYLSKLTMTTSDPADVEAADIAAAATVSVIRDSAPLQHKFRFSEQSSDSGHIGAANVAPTVSQGHFCDNSSINWNLKG